MLTLPRISIFKYIYKKQNVCWKSIGMYISHFLSIFYVKGTHIFTCIYIFVCAATIIRFMKIRFLRIFFRQHENVFSKLHTPLCTALKPIIQKYIIYAANQCLCLRTKFYTRYTKDFLPWHNTPGEQDCKLYNTWLHSLDVSEHFSQFSRTIS